MLTEEQLIKAGNLKKKIDRIKSYLDNDSKYVRNGFALCDVHHNDAGVFKDYKLEYGNDIHYFLRDHPEFMTTLNEFGFKLLEKELDKLVKEYREYVTS